MFTSAGKGGKRLKEAELRKSRHSLDFKSIRCLCKWTGGGDASLSDWKGEFSGGVVLGWVLETEPSAGLRLGLGLRHMAPLPVCREGSRCQLSCLLRIMDGDRVKHYNLNKMRVNTLQVEFSVPGPMGSLLWPYVLSVQLHLSPCSIPCDLNQSSELTEGESLFSHLSPPLLSILVT